MGCKRRVPFSAELSWLLKRAGSVPWLNKKKALYLPPLLIVNTPSVSCSRAATMTFRTSVYAHRIRSVLTGLFGTRKIDF